MAENRTKVRIFISACEPSGDQLGAEVMSALVTNPATEIEFTGIGGSAMAANGFESLFPADGLAVMGLGDVLPAARHGRTLVRRALAAVKARPPDLMVTIDSMGFHKRLVGRVRREVPALTVLHIAAPKYWAWWPGRAKGIQGLYDEILCLFPFEPEFFSGFDLNCRFVGHPAVNRMNSNPGRLSGLREKLNIPGKAPIALVLPGSRPAEVRRHLPPFGEAVALVRRSHPDLVTLTPTVPLVADAVSQAVSGWGPQSHVIPGNEDRAAAFGLGQIALAASGTVTLELAALNIPHVTAYRVGPVSALIARRMIRIDHVNLVNILAGETVVPEFLQGECRSGALAAALQGLLTGPEMRAHQLAAFKQVISDLGGDGVPPAMRTSEIIRQYFP